MTDDVWPPLYPVLATWKEGRRLVGRHSAPAEKLWALGTPPVWGLALKPVPDLRLLASVRVGDELAVDRGDSGWVVLDEVGRRIGWLQWKPGDDGRRHAVTGVRLRLPANGRLLVERLVLTAENRVVDLGGVVYPS